MSNVDSNTQFIINVVLNRIFQRVKKMFNQRLLAISSSFSFNDNFIKINIIKSNNDKHSQF